MKITVDTKEDSQEEIKKAIGLLSTFVHGEVITNAKTEVAPVQQNKIDVGEMLDEIKKNPSSEKDEGDVEDLSSLKIVEY